MGCWLSSKVSDVAEAEKQQKRPATGDGGASSSGSGLRGVAAGGEAKVVVNSTATLLAAEAAGLALTAAEAIPIAGPIIRSLQRVHEVYQLHEDIQVEITHLVRRLQYIVGKNDYESLSTDDKRHLDTVLEGVRGAVERGYLRCLETIFKPEDVKDDLIRAGRHLTEGVCDIGLFRNRVKEVLEHEALMPQHEFELSSDRVFVERYLTESRCKVYLGVLTLPKGQMAKVAIKLRRPEGASTVEDLRKKLLEGECKRQYLASHRSILKLLGLVMHHPHPECQGCVLMVTPYVELGSLEDVMVSKDPERSRFFPRAQRLLTQPPDCKTTVLSLLVDVASGLKHIHNIEEAITHLDVKPQNILVDYVTPQEEETSSLRLVPKITDFDISRQHTPVSKTTTIATAIGTYGYMSPEAADPKLGKKGPKSDVFAFGMVIHFCVTRRHPFEGMSDVEILLAMAKGERPQLRAEGSTCPAWSEALCSIAESAWVQEPTKRPTAETLWGRLWNQLEASASKAEPGSAAPSSVTAPQQPPAIATGIASTPSAPQQPPVSATGSASSAAAALQLAKGSSTGSTAAAATPSALLAAGFDFLAAGGRFSLLLLQKRKELISFGYNDSGQRDLPQELRAAGWTRGASRQLLRPSVEVLQVAAGGGHTLYLVQEQGEEGRTAVHAAGMNNYKQCEVPQALGRGGPKVKAVAAGEYHSLALTVAGKALGWGRNYYGETDVQAFEKVQLVAAGGCFSAVVTKDRKLHVVGYCRNEELRRGVQLSGTPIAMAARCWHIVVLSSNGRAQAFRTFSSEYDNHGQEIVPSMGERRIEAIACGGYHTVYLLEGGGVVAAGRNKEQQCDCRLQSSAIAVAAGNRHTLVRLKDGTLQAFGQNDDGECAVPDF